MELSEARAVLELTHDQLLRRWDGESSEWTPSRYRAEAIDTIITALDAATAEAQQRERAEKAETKIAELRQEHVRYSEQCARAIRQLGEQRERAEKAEGERDRLMKAFPVYDSQIVCDGKGWVATNRESGDERWFGPDEWTGAVRFAAGLPAKGAADAATPE